MPLLDIPYPGSFTGNVTWLPGGAFRLSLDDWYQPGEVVLLVEPANRTFRMSPPRPAGDEQWSVPLPLDELRGVIGAELERQRAEAPRVESPPPLPARPSGGALAVLLLGFLALLGLVGAVLAAGWPR
jgi:hypothetical protein